MIKFRGQRAGVDLIGIGLTRENMERLKDGQPIVSDLRELALDAELVIVYGETAADIERDLAPAMGTYTKVYRDNGNGK